MLAITVIIIVTVFSYITWSDLELKIYTHGKCRTNFMIMIKRRMAVTVTDFINFDNFSRSFQHLIS